VDRPELTDIQPPTREQTDAALEAARNMREMGIDPQHLGHLALFLSERNQALERFLRDADRYFRFGQDDGERRSLVRQIERLSGRLAQKQQFPV
jgi:hypothetical protein